MKFNVLRVKTIFSLAQTRRTEYITFLANTLIIGNLRILACEHTVIACFCDKGNGNFQHLTCKLNFGDHLQRPASLLHVYHSGLNESRLE